METAGNSGLVDANAVPLNNRPLFYEKLRAGANAQLQELYSRIDVFFDSTGGISSVRTYQGEWDDGGSNGAPVNPVMTGPLELFVTPTELEAGSSPLYEESNLWVTISNTSGGVSIGYNTPPLTPDDLNDNGEQDFFELVTEARSSAATGRSARQ